MQVFRFKWLCIDWHANTAMTLQRLGMLLFEGMILVQKVDFDFFMRVAIRNLHAYSGICRCMAPNHVIRI